MQPTAPGGRRSAWAISPPLGCSWPALTNPVIITQPENWYSFYRPAEGGRLSRPRWLARHPDGCLASQVMKPHMPIGIKKKRKFRKLITYWKSTRIKTPSTSIGDENIITAPNSKPRYKQIICLSSSNNLQIIISNLAHIIQRLIRIKLKLQHITHHVYFQLSGKRNNSWRLKITSK